MKGGSITLENQLTVLGFLGEDPMQDATPALNLKELVYDKFRGFKTLSNRCFATRIG